MVLGERGRAVLWHGPYQHSSTGYVCLPLSLQACWQASWSRTSLSAGGRGSASAVCTSRGSRTAGNAPAPIKPSGSSLGVKTEKQQLGFVTLGSGTWIYVSLCPRKWDHSNKPSAEVETGDKEKSGFPLSPTCERWKRVVLRGVPAAAAEGKLECPAAKQCHSSSQTPWACVSVPWLRTAAGGEEPTQPAAGLACGNTGGADVRLCWPQLAVACVLLRPGLQLCASIGHLCLFSIPLPPFPKLIFSSDPGFVRC